MERVWNGYGPDGVLGHNSLTMFINIKYNVDITMLILKVLMILMILILRFCDRS
jgi:hypothetical protein